MIRYFLILVTTVFAQCQSTRVSQNVVKPFEENFESLMYRDASIFKVDMFVDGDTFWVLDKNSRRVKIRLICTSRSR